MYKPQIIESSEPRGPSVSTRVQDIVSLAAASAGAYCISELYYDSCLVSPHYAVCSLAEKQLYNRASISENPLSRARTPAITMLPRVSPHCIYTPLLYTANNIIAARLSTEHNGLFVVCRVSCAYIPVVTYTCPVNFPPASQTRNRCFRTHTHRHIQTHTVIYCRYSMLYTAKRKLRGTTHCTLCWLATTYPRKQFPH